MKISYKTFNALIVALSVLAVLMLPFWPYARWGYFPTGVLVALVIMMFSVQRLQQN